MFNLAASRLAASRLAASRFAASRFAAMSETTIFVNNNMLQLFVSRRTLMNTMRSFGRNYLFVAVAPGFAR